MGEISKVFLTSFLKYVIDLSRGIKLPHFDKAEVPILEVFHFIRVKCLMPSAVLGSSVVSKPHIVALPGQLKSRSQVIVIHDP